MSDMRKLLESMNKFAGEPEQKPGDQVRGTEKATKRKDGKHPFAGRLVGAAESKNMLADLEKELTENAVKHSLAEEFAQYKKQLDEFAPNDGGGSRKFIPWPEFIEQVKQIVGKDFAVKEKIIKSTIQDRFIPHDPMEFGPTMLYSYYEARAGRGKGAVSTRGSIQIGKYFGNSDYFKSNNPELANQLLTSFSLLKGHPFERHFDLTFDNIYKIANIIMGNTQGAYQMPQKQGVAEQQINEYLVKAGMPVQDVLQLNIFQDFDAVDGASEHFPEFANSKQWAAVERKYVPIMAQLKKRLLATNRRLTDAEAEAVEETWYDGSDAYDDCEVEYLVGVYNNQIDILEALLAGNITDEEFLEQGVAEGKNHELDSLYNQYNELDYDGNSESDREQMRFIQQRIRDLKAKQGVAEEESQPTKYRATVEYGPTAADAHFVTVTANSTEEAEAKVEAWCKKKGVRNPMITINGADRPMAEGEEEALQYATQAHAGQTRAGGDPYITHPMRVADHIRQYKQSHNLEALISAAYLHDTIEDTDTTHEILHDLFGGLVASLVQELTSDPAQIKQMGKAQYLAHKMAAMSSYGLVIKLADRLDNVKDITTARTPQWRAKYKAETEHILNFIEKNRVLTGTHRKLIGLIRNKIGELVEPQVQENYSDEAQPIQNDTAVEAYGYAYNKRDQRVMWRKEFSSQEAAYKWADSKNATVIGIRPAAQAMEEGANPTDTVTMDIPLMIRLFEYAREDAKTDMDLHNVAERLIKLSAGGQTLTMDNYNDICPDQETVDEDVPAPVATAGGVAGATQPSTQTPAPGAAPNPAQAAQAKQNQAKLQQNLANLKSAGVQIDPAKAAQTFQKTDTGAPMNAMDKDTIAKMAPAIGNVMSNPSTATQLNTLIKKAGGGV